MVGEHINSWFHCSFKCICWIVNLKYVTAFAILGPKSSLECWDHVPLLVLGV